MITREKIGVSKLSNANGCNEIELSNFVALDSNIKNKFASADGSTQPVVGRPINPALLQNTKSGVKKIDPKPEERVVTTETKLPESKGEDKILGMPKNVGIAVVSVAVLSLGAFVYLKFIK